MVVKLEYGDTDHNRTGMLMTNEVNATPKQTEIIDMQRILLGYVRRHGWASLASIIEHTRSSIDVESTDR